MTKYNSVYDMIKTLSSRNFCVKYGVRIKFRSLQVYQDLCRIYLDEYKSNKSEIETNNFFYQRFLRRI